MGKRELVLIVCFMVIGVVVYQATAPPPNPNDRSFSFGRLIEMARREITGNRAHVETTTASTVPIDPDINELRITGRVAELEITGEDRTDIQSTLRVNSNAYNDAEAKQYANETELVTDRAGSSLAFRIKYPEGRHSGRQRGTLTFKVPSRIRVRIEPPGPGKMTITNIAGLETMMSRGMATIRKVHGRVAMEHRGGPLVIEQVDALKFVGRGAELKVTGVRGDTSIRLDPGGEFTATELRGAIDVEARNAEITLPGLEGTQGPIRVNINGGSARLHGIRRDTRIDARNGEVDVVLGGGAPVTIYNDGEDIAVSLPASGYRLDALVTGGRITPVGISFAELGVDVNATEPPNNESRVSGAVNGGGPTITIRGTRGDLTLRGPTQPK